MRENRSALGHYATVTVLCLTLALLGACGKTEKQKGGMPPAPVTIGTVGQADVPVQMSAIGTVEAFSTVGVKAQVSGTLMKVHFREGQEVRKGDLLFTIDPKPYEAALRKAEAAMARDTAQLENARAEERRYAELVKKGYVSLTEYERVRTNAEALAAVVQSDAAQVEDAGLQLGYCTIRSPLGGRTGSLMVHEGNLIKANADSPIVTILQIEPVQVSFSAPERSLPEIRKHMEGGALRVEAYVTGDNALPAVGKLSFIENAVDVKTGTIMMKGTFENSDRRLWPGQFVNVVITLSVLKDAMVVPSGAVQTGQQGQYVFVVTAEKKAEMRPVSVGQTTQDIAVIEKGLSPGEQIVTDGQMRLFPGATVEIKQQEGTAPGKGTDKQPAETPGAPKEQKQ